MSDHRTLEKRQRGEGGTFVTKLTPEVVVIIVTAIRAGVTLETAAKYGGITRSTLHQWLQDGRYALNAGVTPEEDAHARFVAEVDEALSEFKINAAGGILQAGRDQWQALAWLLERRFPDEYGRRQRVEHANAEGAPFMVAATPLFDPSKLSEEDLESLIVLMEKARPDGLPRLPLPGESELRLIEGG